MKKRVIVWLTVVLIFLFLVNVGPIHSILTLFLDLNVGQGTLEDYTTKDLIYQGRGPINAIRLRPEYKKYRLLYSGRDTTLYRTDALRPWKFWRWVELISNPYWCHQYLPPPPGFHQMPKGEIISNPPYVWDEESEKWLKKDTTGHPHPTD